ncbi:YdcF family protein [Pseudanabaena sp. FACHB-2040]|uniref:YdcF family protein n=1 Tax=Pseudanabaena sp. FACHB-2040 TaxID=2692859 RepID=UPI0016841189|nr:YdcF family protein [Pseudanabaena sp. FACHB-2040]MBD2260659.1 YdcF family protein [Pseudanabaena sp. FACHB-2040]
MLETLRSFFGLFWIRFSWKMYGWLTSPYKVTLGLLILMGFLLLFSSARLRRQIIKAAVVVLAAYWFLISPVFSSLAVQVLVNFVPQDTGQPADAVVVLARKKEIEGERYNSAISLLESGRVPQILTLGRSQSVRTFQLLQQRNLPAEGKLSGVACAWTTKQEAQSVASILGPQGIKNIILITDSPHMLRSWLTFKSVGFAVTPYIEPLPATVRSSDRTFLAMREYLGLLSYAVLGRFKPSTTPLPQLAQEAAEEFPPERCAITLEAIRDLVSQRS